jgi:DNA-binding Lrp family transcriptional regulator
MDVEHLRARQDETELEVLDCHGVAGGFDYFLKIRVRDVLDFNRLHGVKRPALPGVRQTLPSSSSWRRSTTRRFPSEAPVPAPVPRPLPRHPLADGRGTAIPAA